VVDDGRDGAHGVARRGVRQTTGAVELTAWRDTANGAMQQSSWHGVPRGRRRLGCQQPVRRNACVGTQME
jgi:hypothetical protein